MFGPALCSAQNLADKPVMAMPLAAVRRVDENLAMDIVHTGQFGIVRTIDRSVTACSCGLHSTVSDLENGTDSKVAPLPALLRTSSVTLVPL